MPRFLLFCHRFFELRYLVASGILRDLAAKGTVTVMMPADLVESFRPLLPDGVQIEVAHYKSKLGSLEEFALNFFGDILYLTFPNTHILPNATAKFHRDHYTSSSKLKSTIVVAASKLASSNKLFLNMCLKAYSSILPKTLHEAMIQKLKPDLMIGCTFGMSVSDAIFLAEARFNKITSAVIVQSWDRTSNKGYPTVRPDHALVWNNIMKKECEILLGFDPEDVHVTGSPLWDEHFHKLSQTPDANWRKNLNIPETHKVIFFSCGGFGSHPANMQVIPEIFELARTQPFENPVHIVFRLYPQYLSPVTQSGAGKAKKEELEALLDQYRDIPDISILYPEVEFDGKNFMPSAADHAYMTQCLYQCDLSISQVSSQMIEACIFDKPAINIEFGRRVTEKYDLEIADYKTEHLLRLYRTNAIYRVQKPDELEEIIGRALENPAEKNLERQDLVNQEAPVHRGDAAKATANMLEKIARTIDLKAHTV